MDVVIVTFLPPQEPVLARLRREYLSTVAQEDLCFGIALAVTGEPVEAPGRRAMILERAPESFEEKRALAEARAGVKLVKFFTE